MAGGEICLLIPNRPLTFGEKMCQVRRRHPVVPRCLFGPPDPVETQKLLEEHFQRERERARKRWGFDLDAVEAAFAKNEKSAGQMKEEEKTELESRIPTVVPVEVEERLAGEVKSETSKRSSCPVQSQPLKKSFVKFQKRVRVAGSLRRQTYLPEYWRSRRSVSFIFGKNKPRTITLQSVTDSLEAPAKE